MQLPKIHLLLSTNFSPGVKRIKCDIKLYFISLFKVKPDLYWCFHGSTLCIVTEVVHRLQHSKQPTTCEIWQNLHGSTVASCQISNTGYLCSTDRNRFHSIVQVLYRDFVVFINTSGTTREQKLCSANLPSVSLIHQRTRWFSHSTEICLGWSYLRWKALNTDVNAPERKHGQTRIWLVKSHPRVAYAYDHVLESTFLTLHSAAHKPPKTVELHMSKYLNEVLKLQWDTKHSKQHVFSCCLLCFIKSLFWISNMPFK